MKRGIWIVSLSHGIGTTVVHYQMSSCILLTDKVISSSARISGPHPHNYHPWLWHQNGVSRHWVRNGSFVNYVQNFLSQSNVKDTGTTRRGGGEGCDHYPFCGRSYLRPVSISFLHSFPKPRRLSALKIIKITTTVPWYYPLTPALWNCWLHPWNKACFFAYLRWRFVRSLVMTMPKLIIKDSVGNWTTLWQTGWLPNKKWKHKRLPCKTFVNLLHLQTQSLWMSVSVSCRMTASRSKLTFNVGHPWLVWTNQKTTLPFVSNERKSSADWSLVMRRFTYRLQSPTQTSSEPPFSFSRSFKFLFSPSQTDGWETLSHRKSLQNDRTIAYNCLFWLMQWTLIKKNQAITSSRMLENLLKSLVTESQASGGTSACDNRTVLIRAKLNLPYKTLMLKVTKPLQHHHRSNLRHPKNASQERILNRLRLQTLCTCIQVNS